MMILEKANKQRQRTIRFKAYTQQFPSKSLELVSLQLRTITKEQLHGQCGDTTMPVNNFVMHVYINVMHVFQRNLTCTQKPSRE